MKAIEYVYVCACVWVVVCVSVCVCCVCVFVRVTSYNIFCRFVIFFFCTVSKRESGREREKNLALALRFNNLLG